VFITRIGAMLVGSSKERRDIAGWLLRIAVGGLFVLISLGKFNGDPHSMWFQIFAKIGFGQWFRVATGVIQLSGGLLFLFPGTCKLGAFMLGATMLGAIIAQLTVLRNPIVIFVPGARLAAVVLIAFRDPSLDSTIATLKRRKALR
jgi:putative oxidoreductase